MNKKPDSSLHGLQKNTPLTNILSLNRLNGPFILARHPICKSHYSPTTLTAAYSQHRIIHGQTCIVVTALEIASAALEQHMTNPPAHHSQHSQGNAKVSRSSGNVGFHTRETRLCNVTTFTAKCKIGPVPSFGAEGSSSNSLIVAGDLQHPLQKILPVA